MFFPVVEIGLETRALQPLPLPDGEVGVLQRQFGQRRRLAVQQRLIDLAQLAENDVDGPAVENDVVQGEEQQMLAGCEDEQTRADERAFHQVKRARGFLVGQAFASGGAFHH